MMKIKYLLVYFFLFLLSNIITAQTSKSDSLMVAVLNLSIEELMNTKVFIATKTEKHINESPSIVSVINSKEIGNLGARNLIDLLKLIPGFEFSVGRAGVPRVGVRGYKDKRATSKLLILIDGIPYNNLLYGSAIWMRDQFDVNNIEKIEIMRGPGSALYGRNAFSGVVNIITKTGKEFEGLKVCSNIGTFNTTNLGYYYGINKEKFSSFFSVKRIKTDNTSSKFDNGFGGTDILNIASDNWLLSFNTQIGDFSINGIFSNLNMGVAIGPFINKESYFNEKLGLLSAKYKYQINDKLLLNINTYGRKSKYQEDLAIFLPNQLPFFPNGLYVLPSVEEYNLGGEFELSLKTHENNSILIGFQPEIYGLNNAKIKSNYDIYDPFLTPYISVQNNDTTYIGKDDMIYDDRGWIENNGHDYYNLAFYIQDIYYPVDNVGITIGARFDNDSEFGFEFNPRFGIVWEMVKKLNVKLLYGTAYRAPNVGEQFQLTGFATGNTEIKPETIETTELSFDYRSGRVSNRLTFFHNKIKNLMYAEERIGGIGGAYFNKGKNTSKGIEVESTIMLKEALYLAFNYSYNKSEDEYNGITSSHLDIAPHKVNIGINIPFYKHFYFNSSLMYNSKMEKFKTTDDDGNKINLTQDNIGNTYLLNSSIRTNQLFNALELSFSVNNIFDTKYYYQDGANAYQPSQPGRQFIFSLSYHITAK